MTPEAAIVRATGAKPTGSCYRVLMWEEGALADDELEAWQKERAALLTRMRDAGVKGARGTLAGLERELRELSTRAVEAPLATRAGAGFSRTRAEALAQTLAQEPGLLGYRITANSADILLELTGEEGVDTLLAHWAASTPDTAWCKSPLIQVLQAAEAEERLSALEEEAPATANADETEDDTPFHHVTVMAHEATEALQPAGGRVMVDATLGGGGHSELLLQAGATVWGIDQDPAARRAARKRLAAYGDRLHIIPGNFRNAAQMLAEHGVEQVDGILADIGISSPQVDCAERGFSFLAEGPLDMRMNPAAPRSAADIVNTATEGELADILWQYGEERASRAIARRIVQEREKKPITTTTQLADIICTVLPRKGRQHPATRSFQALRIAVNDELGALEQLLQSGLGLLKSGGRFAVITFHSLEDRAVKRYFEHVTRQEIDRPEWPAPRPNPDYAARPVFRKPVVASEAELSANPRSRSAKLRVIEKL